MKKVLPTSDFVFIKTILKMLSGPKLCVVVLLVIFGQASYVSLATVLGLLIDQVFIRHQWPIFLTLLFPAAWLISNILSGLGKYYSSMITQDVRRISKDIIFQHIVSLPNRVYISRDGGEVESLMQELSFNARFVFNENFPFFIRSAITLLIAMFIILKISWILVVVFLIWLFLYIPISYFSAKNSVKDVSESIVSASRVSAATVEVIQNHELIPAFGTEQFEISRFRGLLDQEWNSFNRAQQRIDFCEFFQRIFLVLLPLSLVCFLIFSESLIKITPGTIASLLSLTLILTNQIGDLGKGILSFLEMKERMKTALSKLACPIELQTTPMVFTAKEPKSWEIHCENVGFNYGNLSAVLNLNLDIKENEKIGIIGYSGAGKTTLVRLLRGLLVPVEGEIRIGDVPLNHINPKYLAKNIAEVSQTIPLFHRTIRENVAYGLENIHDEDIWKILEKAQLSEYVRRLPEGLDTVVGVRGQKLSGGERARIGIARAFIREAKIIILDEATAALDSESEFLIQKGLDELMQGRTVIAIAHRLSTLRKVDRVLVLEKGKLVAQGPHQELIKQEGVYQRLWNTQAIL